ncbi:MAG: HTH-type transcriptional regulator DmlR [Alphaproteobacteria bacterium MarineAlpha5_Bin9]|nr:MAG: HTH-type transcriptional regulator DmlR [Alphaproteobacteria bacterium MarineAlpha5_Bin9]|tara:strand:- start:3063 stop:3950 length:888 start_codon:yes stop_codon:yes gene_type:complete
MDWNKLKSFYEVALNNSISKASYKLNISQSAISRQIQDLEFDLNTLLFFRHQKGVRLTEQGENLFQSVNKIITSISEFEQKLLDKKIKPAGKLTINTTVGFGATWLTPRINKFTEKYPELNISLIFSDEEVDLSSRVADIAVRVKKPTQSNLIFKKFVNFHNHIYASTEYLKKHGIPRNTFDLDKHNLICFGSGSPSPVSNIDWILKIGKETGKRKPKFRVNSIYGMSLAVENNSGLAALPDYMVADKPHLVRVLPNLEGPSYQTYFVYSESFKNDRRLEVFRDFLYTEAKDWRY